MMALLPIVERTLLFPRKAHQKPCSFVVNEIAHGVSVGNGLLVDCDVLFGLLRGSELEGYQTYPLRPTISYMSGPDLIGYAIARRSGFGP